jgi:hypothetical protein
LRDCDGAVKECRDEENTMTADAPEADFDRHNAKMAKKKASRDKIMASKQGEKGW